jgi:hypothetical protein
MDYQRPALADSVINLARHGAVNPEPAFNAVQPTINYTGDNRFEAR